MKTILVATDFSEASISAGKYARSLASAFNSRLILFSAYQALPSAIERLIPVEATDVKQHAIEKLMDQARSLDIQGLPYCYTDTDEGDAIEAILRKVKKENADLIVTGMKLEHKNFRRTFGTTVSALCMKSPVPVLIVPESAEFKNIDTMALAVDHDADEQGNPRLLDVFREIAERFHSTVYVVKVFGDKLRNAMRFHHKPHRLIKMIRTTDPVFDTVDGNDVAEALLQYIQNRNLNILAMLPHRLHLIEKIFTKSITKQLVFSAHIPLLIIPDTNKINTINN
jgi:nucleotide-binding universal stress UspA family protein